MWDHFPIEIGLLDRRTVTAPVAPSNPDKVTNSGPLVLTVKAQPDGSAPIFPTGASLDVWYYTGTMLETNADGYLDNDMARQAGVTVEMAALTWTLDSDLGLYVSSSVLTLPSQTATGVWDNQTVPSVWHPYPGYDGEEYGGYWDGIWYPNPDLPNPYDPTYGYWETPPDNWVWYPPEQYPEVTLACGSLASGSPSSIALRAAVAVWSNAGRGRFFARGLTENPTRSEEHTSELQSRFGNSYAVFCLKKKTSVRNNKKPRYKTQKTRRETIIMCTQQI